MSWNPKAYVLPANSGPLSPEKILAAAAKAMGMHHGRPGELIGVEDCSGKWIDEDGERFDPANGVYANAPSMLTELDLRSLLDRLAPAARLEVADNLEKLYRRDPANHTLVLRNDPKKRAKIDLEAAEAAEARRVRDHEHEIMTRKFDPLPASWARNGSARACWDRKWRPGSG